MEKQVLKGPQQILAKTSASGAKEDANVVKGLPHSLESMNELFGLSTALSIFTRRFNELQKHLESIDKSIDNIYKAQKSKEPELLAMMPASDVSTSSAPGATVLQSADQAIGNSANDESCKECPRSNIEDICQSMGSRALRKYITLRLSSIETIREEVTTALKHAPDPAKLVLQSVGRFYLQGSRAYIKDSPMVTNRHASLLILEFLLLSGCTSMESSVKKEAELAAKAWRKRLISEGGVSNACNEDAQGLLLFVAAYGIPSDFGNQELIELIRISNTRKISNALRQSPFLMEKVPDIVGEMVKKRMFTAAADAAYSFGNEGKFSVENILTSFLRDSRGTWERALRESQGSPLELKEANEKQLAALRTVTKCFEEYKIDPAKFGGWGIDTKISKLEKDILDLDRTIEEKGTAKRKADANDVRNFISKEVNHPHTVSGLSPNKHPKFTLPHEQRAFNGHTFYDGRLSSQLTEYADVSSITGVSLLGAAGAGALQRVSGNAAGASVGYAAGAGGVYPADPSAGSYRWNGDGALNDSSVRHDLVGPMSLSSRALLGSASALEQGFPGQASATTGFGNRNSGADLYQFADAVWESEPYNNSSRASNSYMHMSSAAGRFQR